MDIIRESDIKGVVMPGRILQNAVGAGEGDAIKSDSLKVCFAEYCEQAGPMSPHRHIEETVYVLKNDRAWVRYGKTDECAEGKLLLEEGMLMRFDDKEWHVFEYQPGGSLKLICFYGATDIQMVAK